MCCILYDDSSDGDRNESEIEEESEVDDEGDYRMKRKAPKPIATP